MIYLKNIVEEELRSRGVLQSTLPLLYCDIEELETFVLADPGHAWKYGTSVRVAGERDVYLEEVKDVSMALYSREVAMRVLGRIQDAGRFDVITADRALALAMQYDLNYLVIDHDNLPPGGNFYAYQAFVAPSSSLGTPALLIPCARPRAA